MKRVKNYGTNGEVMNAFMLGEEYPHTNRQRNVYFKGNTLYSYGAHFPLAIRLADKSFLINGDYYSSTTSRHQTDIRYILGKRCKKVFVTSWGAVRNAGGFPDGSNMVLLDHTHDLSEWNNNAVVWMEQNKDNKSELMGVTRHHRINRVTGGYELYHIHRPGASLLRIRHGGAITGEYGYWICGMDEGSFFVSRLPRPCKSVKRAFEILKPLEVRKEQKKDINIPRQGEWFFIPQELEKREARKMYREMEQKVILPRENDRSNPHNATRAKIKGKTIFVSGQVRHPQHRMLRLSTLRDIKIFKAVKNTAVANFSAGGRVD